MRLIGLAVVLAVEIAPLAVWPAKSRSCRLGSVHCLLILIVLMLASPGCATQSNTPKAVTDLKQVVGSWNHGWIGCHGCSERIRASLFIRDDGQWEMVTYQNPRYYGMVGIVDGALRWGPPGRWDGPVTIVEERGREYLTFIKADGTVWTEFDRAK